MSNTQKLTAAMVAAYSNAKVREIETGRIYIVNGVDFKNNELYLDIDGLHSFRHFASKFQLILTSPDNVSDEQALEVAKMYYDGFEKQKNLSNGKEVIDLYFNEINKEFYSKLATELSDICRSLSIDMGYMGIESLITAGLAVEAGTV